MTARSVPYIKRVRQTRYVASDGRAFDSHIEAFRHETFLKLKQFIYDRTQLDTQETENLVRELLGAEDFRVVLLGPKVQEEGK